MSAPIRIGDYLIEFTIRIIQDCALEASADFWERRARDFENACSRPGDYPGRRTPEEQPAASDRCRQIALACRRKAELLRQQVGRSEIDPEVRAILEAS